MKKKSAEEEFESVRASLCQTVDAEQLLHDFVLQE